MAGFGQVTGSSRHSLVLNASASFPCLLSAAFQTVPISMLPEITLMKLVGKKTVNLFIPCLRALTLCMCTTIVMHRASSVHERYKLTGRKVDAKSLSPERTLGLSCWPAEVNFSHQGEFVLSLSKTSKLPVHPWILDSAFCCFSLLLQEESVLKSSPHHPLFHVGEPCSVLFLLATAISKGLIMNVFLSSSSDPQEGSSSNNGRVCLWTSRNQILELPW